MPDSEKNNSKAAWIGFSATIIASLIGLVGSIILNIRQKDTNVTLEREYKVASNELIVKKDEYDTLLSDYNVMDDKYKTLEQKYNELEQKYNDIAETTSPPIGSTETPSERILLIKVKPLKQEYIDDWTETNIDNFGNKYTNGYFFNKQSSPCYATFVLDDKYTKLTATITPASNDFESGQDTKLAFYSLSDIGTTKIYETEELTMLTRPYKIEVPLNGVNTLMIELQSNGYPNVGLVNAYVE